METDRGRTVQTEHSTPDEHPGWLPPPGPRLSHEERAARGRAARTSVPHEHHAAWAPSSHHGGSVELLLEQASTRIAELVPIRHGRMLVSPFTYYRGAALHMAAQLASTPDSGITVQACGDAHLSNFGVFGTPERRLTFDVNDFDETAPGPWEWDVKRLAASLEVAARDNEFTAEEGANIVQSAVCSYRESIREFAASSMLEVWYTHLDLDELLPRFQALLDHKKTHAVWHAVVKARAHDSHQAFDKLCHTVGDEPRIISDPPLIVPIEEVGIDPARIIGATQQVIDTYVNTLEPHRKHLLEQYRLAHLARKVVGVGSVGTDCWIALLVDRDLGSPLLLQIKQAETSAVERFTAPVGLENHGQRVVVGQRLMQNAPDIFLGWERVDWYGEEPRDYYTRQLRDWKGSADVGGMTPPSMDLWGRMCGWSLARAHARSGDRVAIAAYLGKADGFDRALVEFAVAYADHNERDYLLLADAVRDGRVDAHTGL